MEKILLRNEDILHINERSDAKDQSQNMLEIIWQPLYSFFLTKRNLKYVDQKHFGKNLKTRVIFVESYQSNHNKRLSRNLLNRK